MEFEVGDKVVTVSGLYMNGAWREAGLKGKVLESPNEYGSLTVKFKGIETRRYIRPEYIELRKKAEKTERFEIDDAVELTAPVETFEGDFETGEVGVVIDVYTEEDQYEVDFNGSYLTLSGDVLKKSTLEEDDEGEAVPDLFEVKDSPEVQAALDLILARIEEIKTLLTTSPRNEFQITVNEASFVTPEEEVPEPEPVFKKAKEVAAGDLLYTEAGVWDTVERTETKDSGYTSLFGSLGNKIVQVPSGRMVQVLEPVS